MITALACVSYKSQPVYPDGPNVQRNLSKDEYVFEDMLAKPESHLCHATLAHAALSRICNSLESSMGMTYSEEYEDSLAKELQAGDGFRLSSAVDMQPLALKGG